MAEVKVDRSTGKVQVVRGVVAPDMGIVVNPEGAAQQMEGCITMVLGYTLAEEVRFKNGAVLEKTFGTYEIPRFSAVSATVTHTQRPGRAWHAPTMRVPAWDLQWTWEPPPSTWPCLTWSRERGLRAGRFSAGRFPSART
jgi:hypothetical protein